MEVILQGIKLTVYNAKYLSFYIINQ
jgi:hypothetical protein